MIDVVYVIFGYYWQVVVDDFWQFVDVDIVCGDVGGYQYGYVVGFEVVEGMQMLVLVFVVVDCCGFDVGFFQECGQFVVVVFGMVEYQGLFMVVLGQQVQQQFVFVCVIDWVYVVGDGFGDGVFWCDLDLFWVVYEFQC